MPAAKPSGPGSAEALVFFGVPFHNLTFDEALAGIADRARIGRPSQIVTSNLDFIFQAWKDPEMHRIHLEAELVLADLVDRTVAMLPPAPRSLTISRLRTALEHGGVTRIHVLPDDDVLRLAEHVRRTGEPTPAFQHGAGGAARVLGDPAFALVPVTDGPTVAVGLAWRADRTEDDVVGAVVAAATARFARDGALA